MAFVDPDDKFRDPDDASPGILGFAKKLLPFVNPDEELGFNRSTDQMEEDLNALAKSGVVRRAGDTAIGLAENVAGGLSAVGSTVGAGLEAVVRAPFDDNLRETADRIHKRQEKFTYTPRSEFGQYTFKGASELLGKGIEQIRETAGTPASVLAESALYASPIVAKGLSTSRAQKAAQLKAEAKVQKERIEQAQADYEAKQAAFEKELSLREAERELIMESEHQNHRPYEIQTTAGAKEFGIGENSQAAVKGEHPTKIADPRTVEPFEFGARGAVDIPLRPEEQARTYPDTTASIAKEQRRLDAVDPMRNQADIFLDESLKNPDGKNPTITRPLYETGEKAMPVEKVFTLQDNPHIQTAAEAAKAVGSRLENSRRSKQAGQINPAMFVDTFNASKVVIGKAVRLVAFAGDSFRGLTPQAAMWVRRESNLHEKQTNGIRTVRIVAVDNNNGKPIGLVEWKQNNEYLQSDWTYVEPGYRGTGIARELYEFTRELGNDIRASERQTAEGKKMWEAFGKREKLASDHYRPILPRKQQGAVGWKTTYADFKKEVESAMNGEPLPEQVIKAMWDDRQKGVKFEARPDEMARAVVEEIPGLEKAIQDVMTTPLLSLEEARKTQGFETTDIPGNAAAWALNKATTGASMTARMWNNPFLKHGASYIGVGLQNIKMQVHDFLTHKDTGVVPMIDKMDKTQQSSLWKVIDKYEGKKWLTEAELMLENMNEHQIKTYQRIREITSALLKMVNEVRVAQGYKPIAERPGYFPAKFIGDWFVTVKDAKDNMVAVYSANNIWNMKGAVKEIKKRFPDLTVSEVIERVPFDRHKGAEYSMKAYSDILSVMVADNPRRLAVEEAVKRFQSVQANYTSGFFQHLKHKKGIEGSSGHDFRKSEHDNARDAFRALVATVEQGVSFAEFKRMQPEVSKLLSGKEFPKLENAQTYLAEYWDRARGVDGEIAGRINALVASFAHIAGISGGTVRSASGAFKREMLLLMLGYNNPRFLIAQLMQPNQFLWQNLASLQAKGIRFSDTQLTQAWLHGAYYTARMVTEKGRTKIFREHPDIREAYEWAEKRGVIDPQFFEDIRTEAEQRKHNLWGFVNGQKAIRWTEQQARGQAYLTFVEVLKQGGMKGEQMYQLASDMTRHTMVDYRPTERPLMYQNMGVLGDMVSPLTTFKHNAAMQLTIAITELHRSGYKPEYLKPVAIQLAMQALFAGAMGVPGREDIDMILNVIKKFYPEVLDTTQLILQSGLPNWMTHGMSTLTGIDMSPTFSFPSMVPDKAGEISATGAKAVDIGKAGFEALRDQTGSAGYNLMHKGAPTWMQGGIEKLAMGDSNMVPDLKRRGEGVYKRSDEEQNLRMLGLRSIEESRHMSKRFKMQQDEAVMTHYKSLYVEKAADEPSRTSEYARKAMAYGMTPSEFIDAVKALKRARMMDSDQRDLGKMQSYNQYRKWKEQQKYAN